jgi:hypothetical protein
MPTVIEADGDLYWCGSEDEGNNHYNRDGFMPGRRGLYRNGTHRCPLGFNKTGLHRNGTRFDDDGYNKDGLDKDGYNRHGYNRAGLDRDGYNRDGYNERGFDKDGFNRYGRNAKGFDKDGFDWDDLNHLGQTREQAAVFDSRKHALACWTRAVAVANAASAGAGGP